MIGEAQLSRLVSLLSVGTEEERLPRPMLAIRTRLGQRRLLVLLQRAYPIALLFERVPSSTITCDCLGSRETASLNSAIAMSFWFEAPSACPRRSWICQSLGDKASACFNSAMAPATSFLASRILPTSRCVWATSGSSLSASLNSFRGGVVVFLLFLNAAQTRMSFEIGRIEL